MVLEVFYPYFHNPPNQFVTTVTTVTVKNIPFLGCLKHFLMHLPAIPPPQGVTAVTQLKNKGLGDFQGVTSEINVTGRNSDKSFNNNDVTAVTGEIGVSEEKGKDNGNNKEVGKNLMFPGLLL